MIDQIEENIETYFEQVLGLVDVPNARHITRVLRNRDPFADISNYDEDLAPQMTSFTHRQCDDFSPLWGATKALTSADIVRAMDSVSSADYKDSVTGMNKFRAFRFDGVPLPVVHASDSATPMCLLPLTSSQFAVRPTRGLYSLSDKVEEFIWSMEPSPFISSNSSPTALEHATYFDKPANWYDAMAKEHGATVSSDEGLMWFSSEGEKLISMLGGAAKEGCLPVLTLMDVIGEVFATHFRKQVSEMSWKSCACNTTNKCDVDSANVLLRTCAIFLNEMSDMQIIHIADDDPEPANKVAFWIIDRLCNLLKSKTCNAGATAPLAIPLALIVFLIGKYGAADKISQKCTSGISEFETRDNSNNDGDTTNSNGQSNKKYGKPDRKYLSIKECHAISIVVPVLEALLGTSEFWKILKEYLSPAGENAVQETVSLITTTKCMVNYSSWRKSEDTSAKKSKISKLKSIDELSRIPIYLPRCAIEVTLEANDDISESLRLVVCGSDITTRNEEKAKVTKKKGWGAHVAQQGISTTDSNLRLLSAKKVMKISLSPALSHQRSCLLVSVPVSASGSFSITSTTSCVADVAFSSWLKLQQIIGDLCATVAISLSFYIGLKRAPKVTKPLFFSLGAMHQDAIKQSINYTSEDNFDLSSRFAACRALELSSWRPVILAVLNALIHLSGSGNIRECIQVLSRRWLIDWLPILQGEVNAPARERLLNLCKFVMEEICPATNDSALPVEAAHVSLFVTFSSMSATIDDYKTELKIVKDVATKLDPLWPILASLSSCGSLIAIAPLFQTSANISNQYNCVDPFALYCGAPHSLWSRGKEGIKWAISKVLNEKSGAINHIGMSMIASCNEVSLSHLKGILDNSYLIQRALTAQYLPTESPNNKMKINASNNFYCNQKGLRVFEGGVAGTICAQSTAMGIIELRAQRPWNPKDTSFLTTMHYFEVFIETPGIRQIAIGLVPSSKLCSSFPINNASHLLCSIGPRGSQGLSASNLSGYFCCSAGDTLGCGIEVLSYGKRPSVYFTLNGALLRYEVLTDKHNYLTPFVLYETTDSTTLVANFGQAPFLFNTVSLYGENATLNRYEEESFFCQCILSTAIQSSSFLMTMASDILKVLEDTLGHNSQFSVSQSGVYFLRHQLLPALDHSDCGAEIAELAKMVAKKVVQKLSSVTGDIIPVSDGDFAELLVEILLLLRERDELQDISSSVPLMDIANLLFPVITCSESETPTEKTSLRTEFPFEFAWERASQTAVISGNAVIPQADSKVTHVAVGSQLPNYDVVVFNVIFSRGADSNDSSIFGGMYIGVTSKDPESVSKDLLSWRNSTECHTWAIHEDTMDQIDGVKLPPRPAGIPIFSQDVLIGVTINHRKKTISFLCGDEEFVDVFSNLPEAAVTLRPFVQIMGGGTSVLAMPSTCVMSYSGDYANKETNDSLLYQRVKHRGHILLLRYLLVNSVTAAAVGHRIAERIDEEAALEILGAYSDPMYAIVQRPGCPSLVVKLMYSLLSGTRAIWKVMTIQGNDILDVEDIFLFPMKVFVPYPMIPAANVSYSGIVSTDSRTRNFVREDVALHSEDSHAFGIASDTTTEGLLVVLKMLASKTFRWASNNLKTSEVIIEESSQRDVIFNEGLRGLNTMCLPPACLRDLQERNNNLFGLILQPPVTPQCYTFSTIDSHPEMEFPAHYGGSLVLTPHYPRKLRQQFREEKGPYIAVANEAVPSEGIFNIRVIFDTDWFGLIPSKMLKGLKEAFYVGLCTSQYRGEIRDHTRVVSNGTSPDMWAIPSYDCKSHHMPHSSNAPLNVFNFSNLSVVRLAVNRNKGTIELFETARNETTKSHGVFFTNVPKDIPLYPFVQIPTARSSALFLPDQVSLPRAHFNSPAYAGKICKEPLGIRCMGCVRQLVEAENLKPPNWFRCNECASYNLCQECFSNHMHPGHTFSHMTLSSFLPSTTMLSPKQTLRPPVDCKNHKKHLAAEIPALPVRLRNLTSLSRLVNETETDIAVDVNLFHPMKASSDDQVIQWSILRKPTTTFCSNLSFSLSSNLNSPENLQRLRVYIGVGAESSIPIGHDKKSISESIVAAANAHISEGEYPQVVACDTRNLQSTDQTNRTTLSCAFITDVFSVSVSFNRTEIYCNGVKVRDVETQFGAQAIALFVIVLSEQMQELCSMNCPILFVTASHPQGTTCVGKIVEHSNESVRIASSSAARWCARSHLFNPITIVEHRSYLQKGALVYNLDTTGKYIPAKIVDISRLDENIVEIDDGRQKCLLQANNVWIRASDNSPNFGEGDHPFGKYKSKLRRFYAKYMPDKLESDMDNIIDIYSKSSVGLQGLFPALVKKYGPEPEESDIELHCTPPEDGLQTREVMSLVRVLLAVGVILHVECKEVQAEARAFLTNDACFKKGIESLFKVFSNPGRLSVLNVALMNTRERCPNEISFKKSLFSIPMQQTCDVDTMRTSQESVSLAEDATVCTGKFEASLIGITSQVSVFISSDNLGCGSVSSVLGGGHGIPSLDVDQLNLTVRSKEGGLWCIDVVTSSLSIKLALHSLLDSKAIRGGHRVNLSRDDVLMEILVDINSTGDVDNTFHCYWWAAGGHRGHGSVKWDALSKMSASYPRLISMGRSPLPQSIKSTDNSTDAVFSQGVSSLLFECRRGYLRPPDIDSITLKDIMVSVNPRGAVSQLIDEIREAKGIDAAIKFVEDLGLEAVSNEAAATLFCHTVRKICTTLDLTLPDHRVNTMFYQAANTLRKWWFSPEVLRSISSLEDVLFNASSSFRKTIVVLFTPLVQHFHIIVRNGFRNLRILGAAMDAFSPIIDKTTGQSLVFTTIPFHLSQLLRDVSSSLNTRTPLPAICDTTDDWEAGWLPIVEPKDNNDKEELQERPTVMAGSRVVRGAVLYSLHNVVKGKSPRLYFEVVQPANCRIQLGIAQKRSNEIDPTAGDSKTKPVYSTENRLYNIVSFDGSNIRRNRIHKRLGWFTAKEGDVLGCLIDLNEDCVQFSFNGTVLHSFATLAPTIVSPSDGLYAYVSSDMGKVTLEILSRPSQVQFLPLTATNGSVETLQQERKLYGFDYDPLQRCLDNPFVTDEILTEMPTSSSQLIPKYRRFIEQLITDLVPFVDMSSTESKTAVAVASMKYYVSRVFRTGVLIKVPPLRDAARESLVTVNIRWYQVFSPTPRTPDVALQHSVLAQLYNQLPHEVVLTSNGTQSGKSSIFEQNPLFLTALAMTDNGHMPIDVGGPYNAVWSLLSEELMVTENSERPDFQRNPLFQSSDSGSGMKVMIPNCNLNHVTRDCAKYFHFFGCIMGHMARAKTPLAIDLSPFVWKYLVEDLVTHEDYFNDVDEYLKEPLKSDTFLLDDDKTEEIFPTFRKRLRRAMSHATSRREIDIRRDVFKDCIAHQLDVNLLPLRAGVHQILGRQNVICMLWTELQVLVCGEPHPTLEQVKKCINCSLPEPFKGFFFNAIARLSPAEWSDFFFFASAQKRYPLARQINVVENKNASQDHLPSASTCFSQVQCPLYSSEELMFYKIRQVIQCKDMELA